MVLLEVLEEKNLLGCFVFGFGDGEEFFVFVERGVGWVEVGVGGGVDVFGGVVFNEFWGGVVRVKFDLVDCRGDLRCLLECVEICW